MDKYAWVPVLSKGVPVKNLFQRAGTYYVRAMVRGRRYIRSCPASTVEEAKRFAREFIRAAREGRAEALEASRARASGPAGASRAEIEAAYLAWARRRGKPDPHTAERNLGALRLIGGSGTFLDLSERAIDRWAAEYLGEEPDDSRRRGCRSTLRQARSVFSEVARRVAYKGLKLPDVAPLLEAEPCLDPAVEYQMPPADVVDRILKAGHELGETRPDLYAAFLLMYYGACRSSEAAAARWAWLEEEELEPGVRRWVLNLRAHPEDGWRPKASGGRVPIPAAAVAALRALARPGDPHILPGGSESARLDLVSRDLAVWMREQGLAVRLPAYELRKLRGCFWRFRYGIDRCHSWMRHKSYTTTIRHYADLSARPAALDLEVGFELDPLAARGMVR